MKKTIVISLILLCVAGAAFGTYMFFRNPKSPTVDKTSNPNAVAESIAVSPQQNLHFDASSINTLVKTPDDTIKVLDEVSEVYGFDNASEEFNVLRTDNLSGDTYYRLNQMYKNIPVYGSTMIVAADSNGKVFSLSGNYSEINDNFNITPTIDAKTAQDRIKSELKEEFENGLTVSEPELVILATATVPVLTWKSEMTGYTSDNIFEAYDVLVNSSTGDVIHKRSIIDYAQVSKTVTGHNNGQQTITVEESSASEPKQYQMVDKSRGLSVHRPIDKFYWYQEGKSEIISWNDGEKPDESAVDALANVSKAHDFFKELTFDRKGNLKLFVHVEDMMYKNQELTKTKGYLLDKNGLYHGNAFQYENTISCSIVDEAYDVAEESTHLDTIAHEYAHYVSRQICDFKSVGDMHINAAINEAYSDIFGELVEAKHFPDGTDWLAGDRSLINPIEGSTPQNAFFATYDSSFQISNTGDCYRLSTIISHAAYLMWNGTNGEASAIKDIETLAKLWYTSLYMLDSSSNFEDCRIAVETAAQRLHAQGLLTPEQVKCVSAAFIKVGIGKKATTVSSGEKPTLSIFDDNGSEYFNYHCKIEKISFPSLEKDAAYIEPSYDFINEFDVTEKKTVVLEDLKAVSDSPTTYWVIISDLSDNPGTTQEKYITVSKDKEETNEFKKLLLENYWENMIQCYEVYSFNADGTGTIYQPNPTLFYDKTEFSEQITQQMKQNGIVFEYEIDNQGKLTLTRFDAPPTTFFLQYTDIVADIDWDTGIYDFLPKNESFFYELDFSRDLDPFGNAMYLINSKIKNTTDNSNFNNTVSFYTDFKQDYSWRDAYLKILKDTSYDCYSLYDLNKDQIPELILNNNNGRWEFHVYGISGNETVDYGEFFAQYGMYKFSDNGLLVAGGGTGVLIFDVLQISNNSLKQRDTAYLSSTVISDMNIEEYYHDGKKISATEYENMKKSIYANQLNFYNKSDLKPIESYVA
ncbi:MAG: hypothetical protein E7473_08330 [Ruminococcaceae bacterium]|nr:hypothetical protein [Oscillospiraceae bacterium]